MTEELRKRITDLFIVKSGDYHATKELDDGDIPLISCGNVGHGLIGYFYVPEEHRYRGCLTVAYNGSWPLLAKFHPYEFGAKDDVAVLIPKEPMRNTTLLYVAAELNLMTWRYSYYRHCYRGKVRNITLVFPGRDVDGDYQIDEDAIEALCNVDAERLAPRRGEGGAIPFPSEGWQHVEITSLFDVDRGDFHSLAALDPGEYATVSRFTEDNGIVGYLDKPEGAEVYPPGRITVSTVGGDAFVQLTDFIATDNVLVLTPTHPLQLSTLFFVAVMLNQQRWRYSYGRQPYKAKFTNTRIWIPIDSQGQIDESLLDQLAANTTYWNMVSDLATTISPDSD